MLDRDLYFLPLFWLFISSIFSIYSKKELKIFQFLSWFLFFLLLIIVFLFTRKSVIKSLIQFFTAIIVLFHLFSTNLIWYSNMTNQKFSTYLGQNRIPILLYCYDLKLKVLSDKTTLVLSNIRELDRVPSTK